MKTMHPGFTPGGVNGELDRTVILLSGQVVNGHRASYSAPWQNRVVGQLNASALADLRSKLSELEPGELRFPDESCPTDGPSTT